MKLLFALSVSLVFGFAFAPFAAQSQSNDIRQAGQQFLDRMAGEDFPAAFAMFSPKLKGIFSEAELRQSWKEIVDQCGPFEKPLATMLPTERSVRFTCGFRGGKKDFKVGFNSKGQVSSVEYFSDLRAISEPAPPYARTNSFTEKEFTVVSGKWSLPGTLAVPIGAGPWPAVVLVHGSGAHDRDELLGANRPFRDIAWGLASKGIAVLRYDKRTQVYGAAAFTNSTFTVRDETVDDALAAAAQLRNAGGIDGKRVFVAGHSLGGLVSPRIAESDSNPPGLILLAGTPRHLEDLILEQNVYLADLDGPMTTNKQVILDSVRALVTKVRNLTPADATSAEKLFDFPPSYWLDLHAYDPVATARMLKIPILIIQGGRDYQVTMTDFDLWKAGLAAKTNVTFKRYSDLNHLLISGKGKSSPAEYQEPGHVDEAVLTDIAAWIGKVKP